MPQSILNEKVSQSFPLTKHKTSFDTTMSGKPSLQSENNEFHYKYEYVYFVVQ